MPRHPRSTCASPAPCGLAALLLVATPVPGRGQALTSVAPGTRVRVELRATERSWHGREQVQSVVGTLVETRADTLLLGAWSPKARWRRLTVPTATSPALAAGAAPRSAIDSVRTP